MSNRNRPARHWYRLHIGECPICGRDKSYRERVYGEPPEDPDDRYVHLTAAETYDYCMEREGAV